MKSKAITALSSISAFALPVVAFGQEQDTSALTELANTFAEIVDILIPAMAGLAILGFFYGLAMYIFKAGDEEGQENAKEIMVGGIIALFLILALGGVIEFIGQIFGVDTSAGAGDVPTFDVN